MRSNRRNIAKLIKLLLRGLSSTQDIANETGMDYETVRPMIKELRAEKVVRVGSWRLDSMGRASIAVWELGEGPDAPKPPSKTGLQRTRKYQTRRDQKPLKPAPKVVRAPSSVFDLANHLKS